MVYIIWAFRIYQLCATRSVRNYSNCSVARNPDFFVKEDGSRLRDSQVFPKECDLMRRLDQRLTIPGDW